MSTAFLRRNQTELVPYAAKFKIDTSSGTESKNGEEFFDSANGIPKPRHADFKFITNKIRTVQDLILGFEHRTDVFDRLLLYFLTGNEVEECMQAWRDDEAVPSHLAKTVKDFASKYLSA